MSANTTDTLSRVASAYNLGMSSNTRETPLALRTQESPEDYNHLAVEQSDCGFHCVERRCEICCYQTKRPRGLKSPWRCLCTSFDSQPEIFCDFLLQGSSPYLEGTYEDLTAYHLITEDLLSPTQQAGQLIWKRRQDSQIITIQTEISRPKLFDPAEKWNDCRHNIIHSLSSNFSLVLPNRDTSLAECVEYRTTASRLVQAVESFYGVILGTSVSPWGGVFIQGLSCLAHSFSLHASIEASFNSIGPASQSGIIKLRVIDSLEVLKDSLKLFLKSLWRIGPESFGPYSESLNRFFAAILFLLIRCTISSAMRYGQSLGFEPQGIQAWSDASIAQGSDSAIIRPFVEPLEASKLSFRELIASVLLNDYAQSEADEWVKASKILSGSPELDETPAGLIRRLADRYRTGPEQVGGNSDVQDRCVQPGQVLLQYN